MGAARLCARRELRRRWRSQLALAVLVAVVGGTVLAAVAGAHRTSTAFDRFLAYSDVPDTFAVVGDDEARLDQVRQLPQVDRFAGLRQYAINTPDPSVYVPIAASIDGQPGATLLRPLVLEGRQADQDDPHEVSDIYRDGPAPQFQPIATADAAVRSSLRVLTVGLLLFAAAAAVDSLAFDPVKGSVRPTVVAGREPQGPGEVLLGTDTLARRGLAIGDEVTAEGPSGPTTLTIVGRGVFPLADDIVVPAGQLVAAGLLTLVLLAAIGRVAGTRVEHRHPAQALRAE